MKSIFNPGELKDRVNVLSINCDNNNYTWTTETTTWAKTERLNGINIFSGVGMGAKSVKFTIRKRKLTFHNAITWKGLHCFLTEIVEINRMYFEVTAALIEPRICTIKREDEPTYDNLNRPIYSEPVLITFPGILTEKYLRNIQNEPMTTIETQYVLVTPKVIVLNEGELVTIGEMAYEVLLSHKLDEFKNEYEIVARSDA